MPEISKKYEALLIQAGEETAKEAAKHEVDWQGWGKKMINRVKAAAE